MSKAGSWIRLSHMLTLTIQMTVMTRLKPKLQEKENRKSEIDKNKHVSEID